MHIIHINVSKKQLSKLRNGHKVRIKHSRGGGFNLIVHPERFDLISKTFNRGKGLEIQLTPDEIIANQESADEPEIEGSGIFGKKFDNFLEKKGIKKGVYSVGDSLKPVAKAALLGALGSGATTLAGTSIVASGGLGAGAIPLIYGTAGTLGALGLDYLDNPSKYQSNVGGSKNILTPETLAGKAKENELYKRINNDLGTNYNNIANASLSNAQSLMDRKSLINERVNNLEDTYNMGLSQITPTGRSAQIIGRGMHNKHLHKRREISSVGTNGGFVDKLPPAMMSQPFSQNFQFQHFLPPAYQKYSGGI